MKTSYKILLGVAVVTVSGMILYTSARREKNYRRMHMLDQIADEGYETAQDILFPLPLRRKAKRFNSRYN